MSIKEKYLSDNIKRLIIAIVGLFCIIGSIYNFYLYVSSATDENLFQEPPSKLMFSQNLLVSKRADLNFKYIALSGALLTHVNGRRVANLSDLSNEISRSANSDIRIKVFVPSLLSSDEFYVAKKDFLTSNITQLQSAALVIEVKSGGASDRAGMNAGDIITSINSKSFENIMSADNIMKENSSGRTIVYEIIRNGNYLKLNVTLANLGIYLPNAIIYFVGLFSIILSFFLLYRRYYAKGALIVGSAFAVLGVTITFSFANGAVAYDFYGIMRFAIYSVMNCSILPLIIHMIAYFPSEAEYITKRKGVFILPYALGILLFALSVCAGIGVRWDYYQIASLLIISALILILIVEAIIKSVKEKSVTHRLSPVSLTLISLAFLSIILKNYFTKFLPSIVIEYLPIFLAFFPIAFFYEIVRQKLWGIEIKLKRNVLYYVFSSLLKIALAAIFIKSLFSISELPNVLPRVSFQNSFIEVFEGGGEARFGDDSSQRIILIIVTILIFIVFYKTQKILQNWLDELFYKRRFDFKRAVEELSQILSTTFSLEDLSSITLEKIAKFATLKRAGLIIFQDKKMVQFNKPYQIDLDKWDDFCKTISPFAFELIQSASFSVVIDRLNANLKKIFDSIRAKIIIPIRHQDKIIGAFIFGEKLSEFKFNSADIDFFIAVANQTAVAIENSFLYQEITRQERLKHELEIARRIQLATLPQKPPIAEGLDISSASKPALEVGGDFYDYINESNSKITLLAGDVSGKGVSAAIYMSRIQGVIRALSETCSSPKELFEKTNAALRKGLEKRSFVSAMAALFDTTNRNFTLVRAGHLPLIWYKAKDKTIELLAPKGIALAMADSSKFDSLLDEISLDYETGDIFLMLTDGVTEARNAAKEEFSIDRICDLLKSNSSLSSEEIRLKIEDSISQFTFPEEQFDDLTIIVAKAI